MPLQLPPLPKGYRTLTDPEVDRLRKQTPDLWANPHKTCITCNKQPTFQARYQGQVVEMTCDCVNQWKLNRWLLNAGVDTQYQRLCWEDAAGIKGEVQAAVLAYVDRATQNMSQGHGLTLWSPNTGTGKTMLASLILKTLLAAGVDGYFTQFNEMLDFFTATWRDADERAWFTRKVRNAGVLVVDDIGRENKGRDSVSEAMFDTVIRARVAASRPTIITTNYTPDQLRSGYGENVLSLLSEVNIGVEVSGMNYRPTKYTQTAADGAAGVVRPLVVG